MKTNNLMTLVRIGTTNFDEIENDVENYLFVSDEDALKWFNHYLKKYENILVSREERHEIINNLRENYFYQFNNSEIYLAEMICLTLK